MSEETLEELVAGGCSDCAADAELEWRTAIETNGVQDGRLTTRDVRPVFYLACDSCGETLRVLDVDLMARAMSKALGLPSEVILGGG